MGDSGNHCSSSKDLTVLISCPALLADNQLRCTLERTSTIEHLKAAISTHLDTRPSSAEQRLIFGGRILDDGETLERVFEKIDYTAAPPTVHLVVSSSHSRSSSYLHSAPASPSPLRFRGNSTTTAIANNTNNSIQGHTSTTMSASSLAPNAADARAASAPPMSSSSLGISNSTTPLTAKPSAAQTAKDQGPSTASPPPPPYGFAPTIPSLSPFYHTLQPYQYVIVNGMPYLMPAGYLPLIQQQQSHQQHFGYPMAFASMMVTNTDGSATFVNNLTTDQLRAYTAGGAFGAAAPGAVPGATAGSAGEAAAAAAGAGQGNPQEIAARDQRRAASLWLLMKLAFGVYLFGQNGSFERLVLLHIAALIIFLHQTGRLRIVRRIAPQNPDGQEHADVNRGQNGTVQPGQEGMTGEAGPPGTRSTTMDTSSSGDGSASSGSSSSTGGERRGYHLNERTAGEGSSSAPSSYTSSSSTASATSSNGTENTSQRQTGVDTQDQQQPLAAPAQQGRVSVWRSIEHALLTFVTSLVPAPPPDIDPAVANAAAAGERM